MIDSTVQASPDLRFAAAVAGFGMLLRESKFSGDLTLNDVLNMARESTGEDRGGYRSEFIHLVEAVLQLELLERPRI